MDTARMDTDRGNRAKAPGPEDAASGSFVPQFDGDLRRQMYAYTVKVSWNFCSTHEHKDYYYLHVLMFAFPQVIEAYKLAEGERCGSDPLEVEAEKHRCLVHS
jgi:hypothetical protein